MAKLESKLGIIPKGKIGDLIFYESNNKTLIRTVGVYNSKKNKTENTKSFQTLSKIYSIFQPVIRFDKKKEKMSLTAIFYKYNFENLKQTEEGFDYQSISLCNKTSPYCLGLKIQKNLTNIQFEWEEDSLCQNDKEKIIMGLFFQDTKKLIWKEVFRKNKFAELIISEHDTNPYTFIYGYKNFE